MTPAYFFVYQQVPKIKTMTAPAVWQSCLRGVYDVFAELLRNLRSCVIGLFVCKHPKPNNPSPLLWSRQPPHPSCSAQTLRRVSSFVAALRKRVYFTQLASVKRIGGSREPLARKYLYSSPNPSFGKGGAFAMEFCSLFAYFFVYQQVPKIKTMTAPAV